MLGPNAYLKGTALKEKLKADAVKAAVLNKAPLLSKMGAGAKTGGKIMAPYGFLSGMEKNKDKELSQQLLRSFGNAAVQGAGGAVVGAAVPAIQEGISRAGTGLKSLIMGKSELRSGAKPEVIPPTPEKVPTIAENPAVKPGVETPAVVQPAVEGPVVAPVKNLMDAMDDSMTEAKTLRGTQEAMYSAERGKRFAAFEQAGKNNLGKAGAHEQLAKLGGQLPKVEYKPLNVSVADQDALYSMAQTSEKLGLLGERAAVYSGLDKLLGETGSVVPTNSELILMEKVYGKEFVEKALSKRPMGQQLLQKATDVLNVSKSAMSSGDLSFTLRQGIYLAVRHPKEFWGAFKDQLKYFVDPKYYDDVQNAMVQDSTYGLAKQSGLALTSPTSSVLGTREEAFMSNLAEKIPGFGEIIKASSRAYTGFANKFRFDVFKKLSTSFDDITPDETKAFADFINNGTGRGSLGRFENSAVELNNVFFSPRLMVSRFNLLDPYYYYKLPPRVRAEAMKTTGTFAGALLTTLGVAKLAGADVSFDPKSADFLKIKIGNTRIDLGGGFTQYVRLGLMLAGRGTINSKTGKFTEFGKGYNSTTRFDLIQRFLENKEAPVASLITELLKGKDAMGKELNIPKELVSRVIPMTVQDAYEMYKDEPAMIPLIVFAILGAGVQTYGSSKDSTGRKTYY